MATTKARRIDSIIDYIRENDNEWERTMERLDIQPSDDDSAGWLVETMACNEQGYYEPIRDAILIIPDRWDRVLSCVNNRWEWRD